MLMGTAVPISTISQKNPAQIPSQMAFSYFFMIFTLLVRMIFMTINPKVLNAHSTHRFTHATELVRYISLLNALIISLARV